MAGSHGRRRSSGKRPTDAAKKRGSAKPGPTKPRPRKPTPTASPERVEPMASGPFRLGAIPGATPGKWIDVWKERMPANPLELVPLEVATQREALDDGSVDAALVRLPIDGDGLHVIPLYDETPVVVTSRDSHLTAADELDLTDLAGEVLIVPADDVVGIEIPGTIAPSFAPPATTADAIATVAAGVGVIVVPMSLARLHRRKDADYRPLRGVGASSVALAWPAEGTTPAVEAFVGIVRGRTANSSRG